MSDEGVSNLEQFRKMKRPDIESIAKDLLAMVENGMSAVDKIERYTDIETKMLRAGVTRGGKILKDILAAYEEKLSQKI